jgi:hypothetical protein
MVYLVGLGALVAADGVRDNAALGVRQIRRLGHTAGAETVAGRKAQWPYSQKGVTDEPLRTRGPTLQRVRLPTGEEAGREAGVHAGIGGRECLGAEG